MTTPSLPRVYKSFRRPCAVLLILTFFAQTTLAVRQDGQAVTPPATQQPAQQAGQQAAQPATGNVLVLSPRQGQRGKTYPITIKTPTCTIKFDEKGKEYKLLKEANTGVTISGDDNKVDGGCTYTAQLTVENDAPMGDIYLKLRSEDGNTLTALFSINEVAPGPVPPGLDPQVDVMWSVVPEGIVKDNYGRRVGNNFYCVEIVVGNSTGYDLQIASVGFLLGPIGQAATVVAKTRRDIAKQLSKQNTIESLISQAPAALERVRARLKAQGKEGDQEALAAAIREEMRKVAETALTAQTAAVEAAKVQNELMTELSQQAYGQKLPVSSYRLARGSLEHGQFWDWRNLTINTIKALGPVLTGFLPYFRNTSHRANYSEGVNIFSNPLEKGFELVVPDETVRQLQRLDEQMLRDGVIIPNNQQLRTRALIPKKLLQLEGDLRDDPVVVTQALGTLYLIGDKIAYLNRVRVTSSPDSGEVKPPPTVNPPANADERTFEQGKTERLDLTGSALDQAVVGSDDPTNIKVTGPAAQSSSFSANVTVTDEAQPGPHTLTLNTPSGGVSIPITVIQGVPEVAAEATYGSKGQPKFNPTSEVAYPITVTGKYLQNALLEAVPNADGKSLQVQSRPSVAPDGKKLDATITVPAGTPAGTYEVRVKITNGRPEGTYTPPKFKVVVLSQDAPVVDADKAVRYGNEGSDENPVVTVNPDKEQQVSIAINGTNLNGATIVVPDDLKSKVDVLPGSVNNTNDKRMTATLVVKKGGVDRQYTLKVVNAEKKEAPFVFKMAAQPDPKITLEAPRKVKAGQSNDVPLTGSNLERATVVKSSLPAGWEAEATVKSATEVTVRIVVPAGATGVHEIALTNTSGNKATFKVEVESPASPAQPQPAQPQRTTPRL